MPITKTATRALRSSARKRSRNLIAKAKLTRALKEANSKNLSKTYKIIDKSAKVGIIHPNKANRLKSRVAKLKK